ncbi:tripartite motif-containing protein 16-like [Gasterosteus aculeatus]
MSQLDLETFSCSVCLDLLKDPVTIPCGHSYCMSCINTHWDKEDEKNLHSCPQCRRTFIPRPVLVKNTMLADLVEQLKKSGHQAAPDPDHCYAGPEDVACDFCTGRKLKAVKSCLVCLISYCEKHLQPHYEFPAFEKHKLVDPSKKLQENICSRHNEMMKIFCRTDQQSICYLCFMDEHKDHDTVSAAAERTERQRELEVSRLNIQQRIQDREKGVKLLQQEEEKINLSADKAVEDNEKIFSQLIRLIEERSSGVKQQVRSQQRAEVSQVKDLQEKLQQEISELKRSDAELQELSHTEDLNQFLQRHSSLSKPRESTQLPSVKIRPPSYFEDVTVSVSQVRDKLQELLKDKWPEVLRTVTEVDGLLPQQLRTREEFLQYAYQMTLDPNTSNSGMVLSEKRRKVTARLPSLQVDKSPGRFTSYQILSRESMTGRCYWEVQWDARVTIAVAYQDMRRSGMKKECTFGHNDKSWALYCLPDCEFRHNDTRTPIEGKSSHKVGVFLDHTAGVLCFYSVGETVTLLHRVQTTFTQPLHAGIALHYYRGDNATLCELQ